MYITAELESPVAAADTRRITNIWASLPHSAPTVHPGAGQLHAYTANTAYPKAAFQQAGNDITKEGPKCLTAHCASRHFPAAVTLACTA
jgi:hypothetical protein